MTTNTNTPKVVLLTGVATNAAVWGLPGEGSYKLPSETVKLPVAAASKGWTCIRERRGSSCYPRTGAAGNAVHYTYTVALNGREFYECKTMAQVLRAIESH